MGIFTKTEPIHCPVCGRQGTITIPRIGIAEPTSAVCGSCGTNLTTVWTGNKYEFLVGHTRGERHTTHTSKAPSYNVEYWKKQYGENWEQAHDEWERKDDLRWAAYRKGEKQ